MIQETAHSGAVARSLTNGHYALPDWEPRWHSTTSNEGGTSRRADVAPGLARGDRFQAGEPKSTVIDGKRVLLIRDTDCRRECPLPTSHWENGQSYLGRQLADPLASTHSTGNCSPYTTRRPSSTICLRRGSSQASIRASSWQCGNTAIATAVEPEAGTSPACRSTRRTRRKPGALRRRGATLVPCPYSNSVLPAARSIGPMATTMDR